MNLIGIFTFQHGHAHGGGGGHGHSHGGHSHDDHSHDGHSHDGHSHGHHSHNGHSHGISVPSNPQSSNSQIMRGVFLHILADTLGSVGVIISAVLMHLFGWFIADPICSIVMAILIMCSVYPLIKDSASILMMRQPPSLDGELQRCYRSVMGLAGVQGVQEPHFWTLCSDVYVGAIKLEVLENTDARYVITHTRMIFESIGVKQLTIQLDYV